MGITHGQGELMKVAIDLTHVNRASDGGKDQVIFNLLQGFRELGRAPQLVIFAYDFLDEQLQHMLPGATIISFRRKKIKKTIQDIVLRTLIIPSMLRANSIDIFFSPKSHTGFRKHAIPSVVLPHDIQAKAFPKRFGLLTRCFLTSGYAVDFWLRDLIIAISDYDQKEISKHYPQWSNKVRLIYNPIVFLKNDGGEVRDIPQDSYLMTVNIIYQHKNIITLLKAFEIIMDKIPHRLLLVGHIDQRAGHLQEYVKKRQLGQRVLFTGYLEKEALDSLLKHCDLYVTPSLYEGFGMTPVEAMGAGIPVVSSKETALFETTQGMASYYEPVDNPKALAETILHVLKNSPDSVMLENIRQKMHQCYDYRKIAQEYWDTFESLHEAKKR